MFGGVFMPPKGVKVLIQNRKARHDYSVLETYEAGLVLHGTEVKSLRMGRSNLKDSYAALSNGELWVYGMHISPYEKGNIFNADPMRPKKLLMHRSEILKLSQQVAQKGLTLIPLSLYLKNGKVKTEIGLCKGKKTYDKRADIAERDAKREIDRHVRDMQRS